MVLLLFFKSCKWFTGSTPEKLRQIIYRYSFSNGACSIAMWIFPIAWNECVSIPAPACSLQRYLRKQCGGASTLETHITKTHRNMPRSTKKFLFKAHKKVLASSSLSPSANPQPGFVAHLRSKRYGSQCLLGLIVTDCGVNQH